MNFQFGFLLWGVMEKAIQKHAGDQDSYCLTEHSRGWLKITHFLAQWQRFDSSTRLQFSQVHVATSEETAPDQLNLTRMQKSHKRSGKQTKQFLEAWQKDKTVPIIFSPLLSEGVPCDSTTLQSSFCKLPWTVFHVPWVQERGWSHPQPAHAG